MNINQWNTYWFDDDESLLLSVYRILIGAAILTEATRYLIHLEEITGAVIPIGSAFPGGVEYGYRFSSIATYSYIILFASALCFTIGLLNQVTVIFLCVTYRLHMYYMAPFGDASTTFCFVNLVFLCFADSSRHLSVDRILFGVSGQWRKRLPSNLIKRLMQWHFVMIFVSTGIHKATNADWVNGTLMSLLFSYATWSKGTWLNEIVNSSAFIGVSLGIFVVAFEICFVFAMLKELRSIFAVCGILFHFLISYITTVPYGFLLFFIPAYVLLYDSDDIRHFVLKSRIIRHRLRGSSVQG